MTELVPMQSGALATLELAPQAWKLAEKIAMTDFVPAALRGKPEAVLACMLAGHEAGISPMQALSKIHVIEGRPAMSAELMRALVLRHGHELTYDEVTTTKVVAAGRRRGTERWTKVTWTMDDAKRGGLDAKTNWRRWPRAMLIARATAELCRMIFPDVLAGISYTIEELTDGDVADGQLVDFGPPETIDEPPAPRARARARTAVTRPAAAPAAQPSAPPAHGEVPTLPGEDDEIPRDDPPGPAPTTPPVAPVAAPSPPTAPDDDWPGGDWDHGDFPNDSRITDAQMRKLRAIYGSIEIRGAHEQKRISGALLGLDEPIQSHSALTLDQASTLIDLLSQVEQGHLIFHLDPRTGAVTGTKPAVNTDIPIDLNQPGDST